MPYLRNLDKESRQKLSKCNFSFNLLEISGAADTVSGKRQKTTMILQICFDRKSTEEVMPNSVFPLLKWTKDTKQASETLTITGLRLTDSDLEKMLELIPESVLEKIQAINLDDNDLTDKGLSLLFAKKLSLLSMLGIAGNRCRLDNLNLSTAAHLPKLEWLDASNNQCSVEKLVKIALAFPELRYLNLANNKPNSLADLIKNEAFLENAIAAEKRQNQPLTEITLAIDTQSSQRADAQVSSTVTTLPSEEDQKLNSEDPCFDRLNHLDLSNNNLTARNLASVEKLIFKTLKFLDLSDNVNFFRGFNWVDWGRFKQLETLCLNNCGLNNSSIQNFTRFFIPNARESTSKLRHLGFSRNKISQEGLHYLETMFLPKLTKLELYSPKTTLEQKDMIKKLIEKITSSGEIGLYDYMKRSLGALTSYNTMSNLIFSRSKSLEDAITSAEEEQILLNNTHLKQF